MKCYSCKRNDHLVANCHVVHYKPDRERIIKKELYPCSNSRFYKERAINLRTNSLSISKLVAAKAKDFATLYSNDVNIKLNTDFDNISDNSNLGAI